MSPNCNIKVIKATKNKKLLSYPGVFTASKCFSALENGADELKIFPSFVLKPSGYGAIKAVLPLNAKSYALGGVTASHFSEWINEGITGFAIGSALFQLGDSSKTVFSKAKNL